MTDEKRSGEALRPSTGATLLVSLDNEIAQVKGRREWSSEDRHGVSLVKDGPLNLLLMVLKRGAKLGEHRTRGPITVHVLSGDVRFSIRGEPVKLSAGSVVALDRDIPHSLEALDESALLLTTAMG